MSKNDTIAAIATAPGSGGVGIVRLSGSRLLPMAQALLPATQNITPRRALYGDFCTADGETIDQGLLLYFPAPASFTGEDVIELHGHGGTVVLNMLLQRCLQLGARPAEPGEFSKRAFLNGKIDLAQAESIADLIEASGQSAARMAMRSLKGAFSDKIHALVDELIDLRMLVEATLDFPEEEIDFVRDTDALQRLARLQAALDAVLNTARQGAILREGMNIVLVGAPNVGKSSLLNALAGDEVAIVTDIAGTTRDTVREEIRLDGIPVHIIDTAGLRETDDIVEQKGIERSRRALDHADIALVLVDPREGINPHTRAILDNLPPNLHQIEVVNKIDLHPETAGGFHPAAHATVRISAKTGAGLEALKQALLQQVGWQGESEGLFLARSRHVHALHRAQDELTAAADAAPQLDFMAEHLRLAQNALSEITGEFTPDDLLGVIFSRFCIGK
ncbi:MAG: tRNA uridine-5-carboxymethylaminomethyl(34) synthesis GTPase MnmE [Neisseria sp.]|nr:tRNA uridine-5-carboxymethylaminomethyl(34) synthesis GTPase MnmE [Neisseria sp.]